MSIEFRELLSLEEFDACVNLQKQVFGFSEIDIISPNILKALSDKEIPSGIVLGLFKKNNDKQILIGFLICVGTLLPNSIYGLAFGLHPDYQKNIYGFLFSQEMYRLCKKKNIRYLYGRYNPFTPDLHKVYHDLFGAYGIEYTVPENSAFNFNNDKILFKWDTENKNVQKRLAKNFDVGNPEDILKRYCITKNNNLIDNDKILIEIPVCIFSKEYSDKQIKAKHEFRNLLNEYINKRNYFITNTLDIKEGTTSKLFYLLEKSNELVGQIL